MDQEWEKQSHENQIHLGIQDPAEEMADECVTFRGLWWKQTVECGYPELTCIPGPSVGCLRLVLQENAGPSHVLPKKCPGWREQLETRLLRSVVGQIVLSWLLVATHTNRVEPKSRLRQSKTENSLFTMI